VTMRGESLFDVRVHAGEKHPVWTQDDGKAMCLGQIHVSGIVPESEWRTLAGTDLAATRRCARATMRLLIAHQRHCDARTKVPTPQAIARVFASYGTGGQCTPTKRSLERAGRWARTVVRL
jgi:hypothetical protein